MKNNKKKNRKKRIVIIKIIIMLISLFLVAGITLYFYGRLNRKQEPINVSKVENTIESYGFIINDNASSYYKQEFENLKNMLKQETWEKEEEAKLIAKLYTIDLLSLNNKINKYEVTSSQYFYPDKREMHTTKILDTFYNLLEDNAYDDRKQELPEVSQVEITSIEEDTYFIDKEEYKCYVITENINYVKDLDYPTSAKVIVIEDNNYYYIVLFE